MCVCVLNEKENWWGWWGYLITVRLLALGWVGVIWEKKALVLVQSSPTLFRLIFLFSALERAGGNKRCGSKTVHRDGKG